MKIAPNNAPTTNPRAGRKKTGKRIWIRVKSSIKGGQKVLHLTRPYNTYTCNITRPNVPAMTQLGSESSFESVNYSSLHR